MPISANDFISGFHRAFLQSLLLAD